MLYNLNLPFVFFYWYFIFQVGVRYYCAGTHIQMLGVSLFCSGLLGVAVLVAKRPRFFPVALALRFELKVLTLLRTYVRQLILKLMI